jgi:hypothetical protein
LILSRRWILRLGLLAAAGVLIVAAVVFTATPSAPLSNGQERMTVLRVVQDQVDSQSGAGGCQPYLDCGPGASTASTTATAQQGGGSSYYIIQLNVSNSGQEDWPFNPGFLKLESNSTRAYFADANFSAVPVIGQQIVKAGSSVAGIVAFNLPGDQVPSSLSYDDQTSGVHLALAVPGPSGVASRFPINVRIAANGDPVASGGWTVTDYNQTDPWLSSLILNGVVENNSLTFFTGQTMRVNIWFEYLKKPSDPNALRLVSVASDNDGFQVVGVQPLPPVTVTGWGGYTGQGGVDVFLKVPPGVHTGSLMFSLEFVAGT